jgi:hypothetical protein
MVRHLRDAAIHTLSPSHVGYSSTWSCRMAAATSVSLARGTASPGHIPHMSPTCTFSAVDSVSMSARGTSTARLGVLRCWGGPADTSRLRRFGQTRAGVADPGGTLEGAPSAGRAGFSKPDGRLRLKARPFERMERLRHSHEPAVRVLLTRSGWCCLTRLRSSCSRWRKSSAMGTGSGSAPMSRPDVPGEPGRAVRGRIHMGERWSWHDG